MTTQYAEEQGFKKKYLAPLIVLMLCAVSLTGAAYAYSTTITGSGDVDYDYYSIDMYSDADGTTVVKENIKFTQDFDVETYKTVGKNYFANVNGNTLTYTTYVKVQSNETETCYITGAAAYKAQAGTAALYGDWAGSDAAKKITCEVIVNEGNATQTNSTYAVTITVKLPDIDGFDLGVTDYKDVAEKVKFIGTGCIEITLTATGTAPTGQ